MLAFPRGFDSYGHLNGNHAPGLPCTHPMPRQLQAPTVAMFGPSTAPFSLGILTSTKDSQAKPSLRGGKVPVEKLRHGPKLGETETHGQQTPVAGHASFSAPRLLLAKAALVQKPRPQTAQVPSSLDATPPPPAMHVNSGAGSPSPVGRDPL